MNTDITQPSGPECTGYAALVPQLRHDALEPTEATALRAHLEHCPFCQAQLAAYDQLDAALRSYARRAASTAPAPDAMIHAALAASTATRASAHRAGAAPRKMPWLSEASRKQPVPQEVRSMRFTRQHPLVATIAALLVIVMAAALFTTFAQSRFGATTLGKSSTPTVHSATVTSLPATHAISAQQAWGANPSATRTLDTQIDATHVFQASAISPDGKLLIGYQTPMHGTVRTQEQAGYFDIATRHFTAIGLSQPWPEPPGCCQTDGRYLLVVLDTSPGATCGLCHLIYYSYDMVTGQVWQIAKGSDYEIVNMVNLDHALVLLSTGQGLFEANLATHTVAHLPFPPTSSPDVHVMAFAWPHLVYTMSSPGSSTPATRVYNLMTQADVALPKLDTLQVSGGVGAAVTGDTLFLTQTANIDAAHATTTLYEDDAFVSSNASLHALATYNDQLGVAAANTRIVTFYGALVWDRAEQRFVTLAADGQQAGQVSVVLSGHFLVVLQTNNSSGAVMPQHVTIYDTDTLPTAPSP